MLSPLTPKSRTPGARRWHTRARYGVWALWALSVLDVIVEMDANPVALFMVTLLYIAIGIVVDPPSAWGTSAVASPLVPSAHTPDALRWRRFARIGVQAVGAFFLFALIGRTSFDPFVVLAIVPFFALVFWIIGVVIEGAPGPGFVYTPPTPVYASYASHAPRAVPCRVCGVSTAGSSLIACSSCNAPFPASSSDAFFARIAELAAAHGMRVAGALGIAGERFGIPVSITHSASGKARLLVEAIADKPPRDAIRARVAELVPDARVSFADSAVRVELPGGEPDAFPLDAILDALTSGAAVRGAGPYR